VAAKAVAVAAVVAAAAAAAADRLVWVASVAEAAVSPAGLPKLAGQPQSGPR